MSDFRDKQRSGRPSSAVNPGNSAWTEELIRDDRRVTIDNIAERLGISCGSAAKIVRELGFAKIYAGGFPDNLRILTSRSVSKPFWSFLSATQVMKRFSNV